MPDAADLFETVFRHAAIGIAVVGLDGRFLRVNDALCAIVGYPRDQLLALDYQRITHPADLEADLAAVARLVAGEIESYDREKRYLRRDGTIAWALMTATVVRHPDGRPRFVIAQVQDVSRRHAAESEVARLFETSPDLLAVAGTSGRLDLVNPAWQRTLGWTADELTSRDFLDFIHPDDRARTLAEAERVYAGAPSRAFRNRYRARDGEPHWLEWNTRVAADGRLFCVVRDVTAQVESERARGWLAAVIEHSSDAVIGADVDGNIFSWNDGATHLYGYTADEMRGRHISNLGHDDATRAAINAVWRRAVDGVPLQAYDASRRRKDGTLVDVEVRVRRIEDGEGTVLGWSITAHDITDRRRLTEALEQQVALYGAIARSLPRGAVTVFDRDLRFVAAEGAELLTALGVDRAQLLGRSVSDAASAQNRDALERIYRRAIEGHSTELEAERAGMSLLIRVAPLHDGRGGVHGGIVLSLDVTAQRRQELLLRAIADNIPNAAVLIFDTTQVVTYAAGPMLHQATRRHAGALVAAPVTSALEGVEPAVFARVLGGLTLVLEHSRDGQTFEIRAMPIRDQHDQVVFGLVMLYDVTARRAEADELRRSKLLLDAAISNIGDGVALLDGQRRLLLANQAYAEQLGLDRSNLVGIDREQFLALVKDRFAAPDQLDARLREPAVDEASSEDFEVVRPRRRVLRRTIKQVGVDRSAGYLIVWRDVTAEHDLLAERQREALSDALTGIANRRAGARALSMGLDVARRDGTPTSVALFDIDHFKRVNDLHGHAAGDVVLRAVARVLADEARASDVVARWGGEEFIAVLAGVTSGAVAFCERVRLAVRALRFASMDEVTISAGVAEHRAGDDVAALLARADEKLYQAKASGRDRVAW